MAALKFNSGGGGSVRRHRRLIIHLALFLIFWLTLRFVVIPWEVSGRIPAESYPLIEGQRAYARILREKRPTLAVTLRGLNMAKIQYAQEKHDNGRTVVVGNVRINFNKVGEFMGLVILTEPERDS